jgi:Na+/H+ antiporter NhaD/arsenite permease-like protein
MPVMFFALSFVFAAIGAGNIAATALMAPLAMAVAGRAGISAFLMTIAVVHGALAGALSPIAPTGIIARNQMARMDLTGYEWQTFGHNLLANLGIGMTGYLVLGGWRLFGRTYRADEDFPSPATSSTGGSAETIVEQGSPHTPCAEFGTRSVPTTFQLQHGITLAIIAVMVIGVIFFRVDIGMAAFAAAVLVALVAKASDLEALGKIPWAVIVMVCGVTVLTSLLEKTGGTRRFSQIISALATQQTAPGVVGFFTGLVSVYSSTSGVVLPAFLPVVPRLVEELGGDPVRLASSIIVVGHLVDSSPLSTLGALCIACAPVTEDRRVLFNKVLAWGLSMAVIGAVMCYVVFGLL